MQELMRPSSYPSCCPCMLGRGIAVKIRGGNIMAIVKSFSVGEGDMYYIKHDSDNFTMIDCCLEGDKCTLSKEKKSALLKELMNIKGEKGVDRFISTHPDEDHIGGLRTLDEVVGITNFYCTRNDAWKTSSSDSFEYYKSIRDSNRSAFLWAGMRRKWLNDSNAEDGADPGSSGIFILWPKEGDHDFNDEQFKADTGESFNNISPIFVYNIANGPKFMWMGDIEKDFLVKIKDKISWPNVDVLFAPHHGRDSGKVPQEILTQLKPQLIIIGEAESKHLNYYSGWNTLTQISAGDITFRNKGLSTDVYSSSYTYDADVEILKSLGNYDIRYGHYLGTFKARQ